MKDKLQFIDEVLERLEDAAHGMRTDLSTARKYCRELMGETPAKPEPNWEDAPKWANYHAVDADGEGYWFENKPLPRDSQYLKSIWVASEEEEITSFSAQYNLNNIDWKQTLTKRP